MEKQKKYLTDAEVEAEIARLAGTAEVKAARREERQKYKNRRKLYALRALYKRGAEIMKEGEKK